MAATAIREMRNNPMNGETLYVRKDVQETRASSTGERPQRSRRNDNEYKVNLPSEWRRANDEVDGKSGQYDIDSKELKEIESLVVKRDMERRKRNYDLSDSMRDQLKEKYSVHVDDDLKLWWTDVNGHVPGLISDIKGEGRWGKKQQVSRLMYVISSYCLKYELLDTSSPGLENNNSGDKSQQHLKTMLKLILHLYLTYLPRETRLGK